MTGKHGLLAGGSIALATALAFAATAQPGTASSGATAQSNGDAAPEPSGQPKAPGQWYTFNGNLEAQKFSPATQITPENVDNLQVAWQVHTGDMSDGSGKVPATDWMTTPLFANNTVYVATPFYNVFAIDPGSGKIKWEYTSNSGRLGLPQGELKNRGVSYWDSTLGATSSDNTAAKAAVGPQTVQGVRKKVGPSGAFRSKSTNPGLQPSQANYPPGPDCLKRVYVSTEDAKIHSIDADTGQPCTDFGENGVLDLDQWNPLPEKQPMTSLQAPTVYKDELLIGWSGNDWAYQTAIPGSVFAVDARTGKLKWTFEVIPPEDRTTTGTANVWSSMSVDRKRGIVYLPVSSPSPNYYGGNRREKIPLATSVTALDAETGKVLWSRQLVHHDIWDYDTDSAPTLVDIKKDGKIIPALVQSSKQGFLYVLNRVTGEPIYPITEHPVPASDVPGEVASPTQPWVTTPAPVVEDKWPGVSLLGDITSLGQCSRDVAKYRNEGKFTPPSLQGTIAYPPTVGGVEWGGGAVDPEKGIYYVNSSSVTQIYQLAARADYNKKYRGKKNWYAQEGSPYAVKVRNFTNWLGIPCWKGPYGFMSAYDLSTGKRLYKVPLGVTQKWGFYMPDSWGSPSIGAPAVTKAGLIFIGGSMDARVRALDAATGKELWRHQVDAPAVAMPAIYTYQGRQFVVFDVGGNSLVKPQYGDQVIAFALPKKNG